MEASRAVGVVCSGAGFPCCFPAHPPDGVTVQPGNTACLKLQLACDGPQERCYQGKITAQPPLSASCPDLSQPDWHSGDQGSWKHHVLILPTFNSALFKEPRNGRPLPCNINLHCSPRLRNSPLGRRTLTKSQITNQTYLKLMHQWYFEIPSALSNPSLPTSLCIFWFLSQDTELQSKGCAQH